MAEDEREPGTREKHLMLHVSLGKTPHDREPAAPMSGDGHCPTSALESGMIGACSAIDSRADFILVYGMQPRHWMPAFAGMTVKRSSPRKRASRSRTCNCKPL